MQEKFVDFCAAQLVLIGQRLFIGSVLTTAALSAAARTPLTVRLAGQGEGVVVSTAAGIDCGTSCSASLAPATAVTLTATPSDDSTFIGWSGACAGSNNSCSLTLDQAKPVVAVFGNRKSQSVSSIRGSDGVNYVFTLIDSVFYKARLANLDAAFTDISPPGLSGQVNSYDFSDQNSIIVDTSNAGVWRSDDGGTTWAAKNDGLPCQKARAIGIISSNLILAAMRCNDRDEVYRSSDRGENWSRGADFGAGVYVNRFLRSKSGRAIALTTSGLYFSSDSGQSWVNANTMSYFATLPSDADVKDMSSMTDSSGLVTEVDLVQSVGPYVVVNSSQASATGVLKNDGLPTLRFGPRISAFNGNLHIPVKGYGLYAQENGRWVLKFSEQTLPKVQRVVALTPAPSTLFASTRNQGLWRSNDSGATWAKVVIAPPALTAAALFDWAEISYGHLFPEHQADQTLPPYTYRYYPSTGNYLGTDGTFVYVLGAFSANQLLSVGKLTDFACLVSPAACASH